MKKIVVGFVFVISSLYSLEFGYMGNRSFGMGGSGVAVPNSAWSAYYNPALQGLDPSIKAGISSGFRLNIPNVNLDKSAYSNFASNKPNVNDVLANVNNASAVFKNTTESGLALQIPIPLITDMTSSLGFGAFYTTRSLIGLSADTTNVTSNNHSVKVDINSLSILELPISYALGFSTFIGDFYIGVAGKYMIASHDITTRVTNNPIKFLFANDVLRAKGVNTDVFGIDVGFAYSAPLNIITIGVVGKDLNQPSINLKTGNHLKLESQYRLGISTGFIPLTTIALDVDLKANNQFSYMNDVKNSILGDKTQMVSLGGMVNIGFFDIRVGIAKDLFTSREDWLLSGGIGFTFIDIALYSSTKMSNIGGIKIPSNFGIKLGGSFSF